MCAWFTNLQAEEKRLIWGYSSKMEKHLLIQLNGPRSFSPLNRGQPALAVINGRMVLVVGC